MPHQSLKQKNRSLNTLDSQPQLTPVYTVDKTNSSQLTDLANHVSRGLDRVTKMSFIFVPLCAFWMR